MRLHAIKLAGFKSFVDPTTVPFPSNLCAVVGPNGCGKSNIIDAVRWVMGESSAKTLRGESMADVIFNGSTARKPVGQASIELQFDNAKGRMTGQYASYSEISIKRQVTRDGQSNYFLNGVKCRRKDITDIFLGTGLGPRSYSIIEQGMISQLIEAKPEDLRVYLEEAAGISKYKERRKETERRISHTRDNLDRLTDLRQELDRNLHYLEKQAEAAKRYKEYRQEERQTRAQLHVLKWSSLGEEAEIANVGISRLEMLKEAVVANQRSVDAQLEKYRDELLALEDARDQIQQKYYAFGTEIARLEDAIKYQTERLGQLHINMEKVTQDLNKVDLDLAADLKFVDDLSNELRETRPKHSQVRDIENLSSRELVVSQRDFEEWQKSWDTFNQSAAEARQESEVQQSRIAHLELTIKRQNERMQSLNDDVRRMHQTAGEHEIEPLEAKLGIHKEQVLRIEAELVDISEHVESQRKENGRQSEVLDNMRSELQLMGGRRASLEALQQAALGQSDDSMSVWLEKYGLGDNPRLVEQITVEGEWAQAVETVLGENLQALCVPNLDDVKELLTDPKKEGFKLFANGLEETPSRDLLAARVGGKFNVSNLLHGVYTAESLDEALSLREKLSGGESIITKEGIWLGKNWVMVHKESDEGDSIILRQAELDRLNFEISELTASVKDRSDMLDANLIALSQAEAERESVRERLAKQQEALSETRVQLGATRQRVEQVKIDLARAQQEIASCERESSSDKTSLVEAQNALQTALARIEEDESLRHKLTIDRETIQTRFDEARKKAESTRDSAHELALKVESIETQISSTQRGILRLNEQKVTLEEKREELSKAIKDSEIPQKQLREDLEENLAQRLEVERELRFSSL